MAAARSDKPEVAPVWGLMIAVKAVADNLDDWSSALDLYNFAKARGIDKWKYIAARECVMQTFHLFDRMRKFAPLFMHDCPTFVTHVDGAKLTEAIGKFEGRYARLIDMRDSVGHMGERESKASSHALPVVPVFSSGFSGPIRSFGDSYFTSGAFEGNCFVITGRPKGQKVVEKFLLEISGATLASLVELVSIFFEAFAPIIAATLPLENGGVLLPKGLQKR
jgi:hypothetical protein